MALERIKQSSITTFLIILSGFIYAIALKYFVLPSKVVLTGSEGIAAALSYFFESNSLFITLYFCFQIALVSFAFFKISRTFAIRTLGVVLIVSFALAFLPDLEFADPEPHQERIILVIFGGIISGVAKALAFKNRGSTGDEDILGAYFSMKYLKPVGSIAVFSAIFSTSFGLVLDFLKNQDFESVVNTLMYTSIYIFAATETLNNLYHKFKITNLTIITSHKSKVAEAIRNTFDYRTFTTLAGIGGFSGRDFSIVQIVITREELPIIRQAVESADPSCFIYTSNLEEVSSHFIIPPIK